MLVSLESLTWEELAKYLSEGKVREIPDDAYDRVRADTSFPFWDLTIKELVQTLKGETPKRLAEWMSPDLDAYSYVARNKGWKEWLSSFTDIMRSVSEAGTPSKLDRYVRKGLPEMTAEESLLTFTRHYFVFTSFEQASSVTLGDYYLARKDDYIKRLAEKRARDWQENEMKKSRGSRRGIRR